MLPRFSGGGSGLLCTLPVLALELPEVRRKEAKAWLLTSASCHTGGARHSRLFAFLVYPRAALYLGYDEGQGS